MASMDEGSVRVPVPRNEPVLSYAPGTAERAALMTALDQVARDVVEIPCVIGGRRITTGRLQAVVMPHEHGTTLAQFHAAGPDEMNAAIDAANQARGDWESLSFEGRAAIFLRAADLLAGDWRPRINAATMLGQSKTCHQAEIDAACEMADFWRFNVGFAADLYRRQPASAPGTWNQMEYRPLEGFVLAVTPFNFTAIAGNLPTAPALMGNVAIWKPAEAQTLAAYYTYLLLEEAGLPPGVVNFLPGPGADLAPVALQHQDFSGLHFTGSSAVFRSLWREIGQNIDRYRSYPRVVGETGGKDFIVAHPSADLAALRTAIVRGGYEYQGQKCSASSRVYLPQSSWTRMRDELCDTIAALPMGDVRDFRNFMGAVINRAAFDKHQGALQKVKTNNGAKILVGGGCDDSRGFFVQPTLIECEDPGYFTMREELFGPIVSVYVYPDHGFEEVLTLVDNTSPYGLTGAVFAQDRAAIAQASARLRHSAGNFYINDKPTGAVVGQQPFGGGRASGTNDKAGAELNLLRWVSARVIKENLVPPVDYRYPYMA